MIGYTAAKHFNCNVILGMFIGAIMLHPTFVQMAENKTNFNVYGIPCHVQNYSSTIIPILLSVFVFSYIENSLINIFLNHYRLFSLPLYQLP